MNDAEGTTGADTGSDPTTEPKTPHGRRRMVAAGLAMGLLAGGSAGVILGTPLFVSAESGVSETSTTIDDTGSAEPDRVESDANESDATGGTTTTSAPESDLPATTVPAENPDSKVDATPGQRDQRDPSKHLDKMAERLRETLQGLVDNGTITQAQADAVIQTLTDARKTWADHAGDKKRGSFDWNAGRDHAGGPAAMFRGMKEIYDAIGLDPSEIFEHLRDGKTIAQIAEDHGVARQTLVDAVIDPLTERLDAAVADGRMTREQADQLLARTTEGLTKAIDGQMPSGWKDMGRSDRARTGDKPGSDSDSGD